MRWGSARDDISQILGERKLRVLRAEQVARTWFLHTKDPTRSAATRLRKLASEGVVQLSRVMLHPEISTEPTPLFTFHPGEAPPDCERIAWQAASRFHKPPVRTTIVTAGPKLIPPALKRRVRATEILHDCILGSVFLDLVTKDASVFERWRHEDSQGVTHSCGKVADAVLDEDGTPVFIECVGAYAGQKIAAIHEAFQHVSYRLY